MSANVSETAVGGRPVLFRDGKAYERSMGRWSRIAGDAFVDWLDAPKNLHWLDVGCGNGAFTEALIGRGAPAAVTAVDPSEGQLSYARTRPGARLAQFQRGDALALPFPDDNFDAATMALAINWVADPQQAANEMARVVRPGGWVATYMWDTKAGGSPLSPVSAAIRSLGLTTPTASHPDASQRENLERFWRQAALVSIETTVIRIRVVHSDLDEFWDSVNAPGSTSGDAILAMPPGTREQLKARLREQLPTEDDGRVAYAAFANAVKGRVPE